MRALSKKLSSYSQRLATKMETTRKHFTIEECVTTRWVTFREPSMTSLSPLELRGKEVKIRRLWLSIITMLVFSTMSWPNSKKLKSIMIWQFKMIKRTEIIYIIEVWLNPDLTTSIQPSKIIKPRQSNSQTLNMSIRPISIWEFVSEERESLSLQLII